jgi:hypothetical protein
MARLHPGKALLGDAATFVKSPPISRNPLPPASANTPSVLFTLGFHDCSAPVASSTANAPCRRPR